MAKDKSQKSASLRIAFVIVCVSFLVLIVNENMTINKLKEEQAIYIERAEAIIQKFTPKVGLFETRKKAPHCCDVFKQIIYFIKSINVIPSK